jgi:hypothetical protein
MDGFLDTLLWIRSGDLRGAIDDAGTSTGIVAPAGGGGTEFMF